MDGLKKSDLDLLAKNDIWLEGKVNGTMVEKIFKSSFILRGRGSPDITLYITSPGGSTLAGLHIHDAIELYAKEASVKGVVHGRAASMASVILQACTTRIASKHSEILIHHLIQDNVSLDVLRNKKKLDKLIADGEETQAKLDAILISRTGKSAKQVAAQCKRDEYLVASKALAFGLIDSIE